MMSATFALANESSRAFLWFPVIVVMVHTLNFPLTEWQKLGTTQVYLLYLSFQTLFRVYLQHSAVNL